MSVITKKSNGEIGKILTKISILKETQKLGHQHFNNNNENDDDNLIIIIFIISTSEL